MITISITPINEYTCQRCQKSIKTNESVKIIQNIAPFCSYKCFFNLIYKLVKKCNLLTLIEINKSFYPNKTFKSLSDIDSKDENELIFDNTKVLVNELLSSEKGGLSLYQQLIKSQ